MAETQTENNDEQFDEIRFEEMPVQVEIDAAAAAAIAHEERMKAWREQNEQGEKDDEPAQKKPRTVTTWGDSLSNAAWHVVT